MRAIRILTSRSYLTKVILLISVLVVVSFTSFVGKGNHPAGNVSDPAFAIPIFDLVADAWDLNGFPANPKWGEQINHPGTFPDPIDSRCPNKDFTGPRCTSPDQKPTLDTPTYNAPICVWGGAPSNRVNGHVNWRAATYQGSICWGGASFDGDYDWSLKPDDLAGLTTENHPRNGLKKPQYIHVEFNSSETADVFESNLWSLFKKYLDPTCSGGGNPTCNEVKGRRMVDGHRAIVTGLMGLDSEHGGYSELHPVYAMAIQTEVNPSKPAEDNWMVFARNWGDEGFCSSKDSQSLPKEVTTLKILVPVPRAIDSSGSGAEVTGADMRATFYSFDKRDCPTATFIKGKGVVLTFKTPTISWPDKPVRRPLIEGEVHIRWHTAGAIQSIPLVSCDPALKEEFIRDQKEFERFLVGREFSVRERQEYFRLERQETQALFGRQKLFRCSAMSGRVPNANPLSEPFLNMNSDSVRDHYRRSVPVRENYGSTTYQLMRQAAQRAIAPRRDIRRRRPLR